MSQSTSRGHSGVEFGTQLSGYTTALPVEPLSVRVAVAVQLTGISRSRIYELIQSGDIEIVKVGRSTFIIFESLKRLLMR